jgi:hypothetical protein
VLGPTMRNALPAIGIAALLAAAGQAQPGGAGAEETRLAEAVNAYRRASGLPPVPLSRSLTLVAQLHTRDLELNRPATGQDPRGLPCNLHSWSAAGAWRPVCYTGDHRYKELMWSKPREITRGAYPGNGYEISAGGGYPMTAAQALRQWQGSSDHNAVILQKGIWKQPWQAMGVGIYGGYAVIWFGREADRAP